jgi:glutamyl-tRNA reductase
MIIGAGKMGEACARHLAKKTPRSILVANRSYDRAQALAADFGGRAIPFEQFLSAMRQADIVVSSTGCPHTILNSADLASVMSGRGNRPLFLIDIAVPRDIDADVQQLPNVYLYNVDHLEQIVQENVHNRQQELARCQAIIAERAAALLSRFVPPADRKVKSLERPPNWLLAGVAACPN